jgi:class 3 adenylate cyclase/tetratricopeptide (TPR) repeat protein
LLLLVTSANLSAFGAFSISADVAAAGSMPNREGLRPSYALRVLTCPSCGQENPEGFRFCGACASPLTEEAPAQREERKVVTVLFADLVGFTQRAERMDPEDVRALLAPYHARLRDELERRGGTVEKFIGDAVMALFGAPVAHEDDPERAVCAALAIRDWIVEQRTGLQVRVAVNTGEVLVALGARASEGEGMAAGDVVNSAARMQAAAPVNGILVGETTFRATRHAIEYREAEHVSAKGKAEPIRVWQALQARSRVEDETTHRARAPLVGRERELDALRDVFARARTQRSVQLVTLVGVPGIGKSRLAYELMQAVEGEPELAAWRQGRSLPYGDGVSFWALGEIVKAQAGVLESDRPQEAHAKLRRAVAALATEPAEANWMTDWLGTLVGLGGDEEALAGDRRGEGFAAWRGFLEALAEAQPLVLVFEDLHWADDGLLDFIDELVEWTSGVPLLALCTARPELLERRPGWGGGKANAVTISLPPLTDSETARLIAALLEGPMLAAETQQALLARAGGNPLYAEQYVRMLAERSGLEGLPETVHGIIAARLDALSAEEKMLLQDAAVVGTVFWRGAVEAIDGVNQAQTGALLHALERKEFVQRARRSSVANETEYAFRHVLVRDVAHAQIPRAVRADKHRRAAEWIESLGRPEEHAELIAHHYLRALELAQAAGQEAVVLSESARRALRDAGDRAASLGANAAAARFYVGALDLWPADDPERARLLVAAGRARFWAEGAGIELLEQGSEALRSAGDADGAAEAVVLLARCFWIRGDRDAAYRHVDQALELAGPETDSHARAYALVARSVYHMLAEEHPEALRLAQEALPLVDAIGIGSLRARTRDVLGISRVALGDTAGLADLREAIELAREAGAFYELHTAYNNLCVSQLCLGRVGEASQTLDELRRSSERFGAVETRRWVRTLDARNLLVDGRWDEALAVIDEEIAQAQQGAPHYHEPAWRTLRASIRLARADRTGASEDSAHATELARQTKDPQILAPALAMRAKILLAEGRRDEAAALLPELFALGRRLVPGLVDSEAYAGEALVTFAWVGCDLGHNDELVAAAESAPRTPWGDAAIAIARGEPVLAANILASLSCKSGEAYTRLRAAEGLTREGRRGEADAELVKAVAFYRQTGATAYIREAEALLAANRDRAEDGYREGAAR